MIEFNKVSTESNFIKNLLHSTYLPLLRTVRDNDFIIRDRLYIYKCNVIRCTNSGYIAPKNANMDINLYPKSMLRKTDDEKVKIGQTYFTYYAGFPKVIKGVAGDTRSPLAEGWYEYNVASYDILGEYYFGEKNDKLCSNFLSSSEGYDFKTHERLGHYLRSLRDMYGLNLMPLYNCFDNQLLRNIHIKTNMVEKTSEDFQTKVYKVPIRFNTDYTICMENVGMTTFAPAFIRHGTLLKLNNTRFGNGLDVTNKYIKLNHEDVIHNKPGLRFKNPIVLRFDNIPQNKKVRYNQFVYTEIPVKFMSEYYRKSPSAFPAYLKRYVDEDETYRSFDYQDENDVVIPEGIPNKHPGYIFELDPTGGAGEDALYPAEDLYPEGVGDNALILPPTAYDIYESINPSIGTFDDTYDSFMQCPEDETLFNKNMFLANKSKYYTFDENTSKFINCNSYSVYDEDEIYYYKKIDSNSGWYEFDSGGNFVPTQDTYIEEAYYECPFNFNEEIFNENKSNYYYYSSLTDTYVACDDSSEFDSEETYYYKDAKKYYKKEMTEIITSYNYDITEDNCCMYDYVEDELYLLIQVPSVFNSNIVILEGNYTNRANEIIYDQHKFELFNDRKLDYLFTKNLKLMEIGTVKLQPYSSTLIQFLLWHVICNLDTINGNMDRLLDDLGTSGNLPAFPLSNNWYSRYREIVYNYADTYPKKYITDNLGYVTTDIESILNFGATYFNDQTIIENSSILDSGNEREPL